MPSYTLNRTYTLRTTNGVISFEKGIPVTIPKCMEKEAQMIGAERVDGDAPDLLEPEKVVAPALTMDERRGQIFVAFEALVEKNDAKDFTAQGVPSVKAVERIVDFTIERTELAECWQEYRVKDAE